MSVFQTKTNRDSRVTTLAHAQTSDNTNNQSRFWPLRRRSAIELAGAFVFISVMAVIGIDSRLGNTKAAANDQTTDPGSNSIKLQVSHDTSSSSPASSTDPSPSSTNSQSGSSTNVSSNTNNSGTTTQVTVNGQAVNVPANGSVNTTIGGTSVNVSNTQSSVGSSSNVSTSYDSTDVSNNTLNNDTNFVEENQTP